MTWLVSLIDAEVWSTMGADAAEIPRLRRGGGVRQRAFRRQRRLSIVREVEAEVDANLKRAQSLRQAVLVRAFGVPG